MENLLDIWGAIKVPVCVIIGNLVAIFFYLATPGKAQDIFFNRKNITLKTSAIFIFMNLVVGVTGGLSILPLIIFYYKFPSEVHSSVGVLTGIVSLATVRTLWSTFSGKWLKNKMLDRLETTVDTASSAVKSGIKTIKADDYTDDNEDTLQELYVDNTNVPTRTRAKKKKRVLSIEDNNDD